jgi:hypothetical protein
MMVLLDGRFAAGGHVAGFARRATDTTDWGQPRFYEIGGYTTVSAAVTVL